MAIPVIDLSRLLSESAAEVCHDHKSEFLKSQLEIIDNAFKRNGVIILSNAYSIEMGAKLEEIRQMGKKFFQNTSIESKRKISSTCKVSRAPNARDVWSYKAMGEETTGAIRSAPFADREIREIHNLEIGSEQDSGTYCKSDRKQSFQMGPSGQGYHTVEQLNEMKSQKHLSVYTEPTFWPEEEKDGGCMPNGFRLAMEEFHDNCLDIHIQISNLLKLIPGAKHQLAEELFPKKRNLNSTKLSYYPAKLSGQTDEDTLGSGQAEHIDMSFATMIFPDLLDGSGALAAKLQVWDRYDRFWHDVPFIDGAVVCQLGAVAVAKTCGRWRACVHRVVNTDEMNNNKSLLPRTSLISFATPAADAKNIGKYKNTSSYLAAQSLDELVDSFTNFDELGDSFTQTDTREYSIAKL